MTCEVYSVRCIIPQERFLQVADKLPLVVDNSCDDDNHIANNGTIAYYDSTGTKTVLSFDTIGSMFNFEYIHRLVFLHEKEFRDSIYQTVETLSFGHGWAKEMSKKVLQNVTNPNISLRYVGILDGFDVGHGVFAEVFIPAGSYIGEYVGLVSSISETTVREDHYNFQYPCCDGGLEINGREYGNLMRFINHSAQPNSEFRAVNVDDIMHVVCVTAVDLPPSAQLTVDYGGAFWMRQKIDPLLVV